MPNAQPPRRLRFRLRHLLAVTALVAVVVYLLTVRTREYDRRAAKVEQLWSLCQESCNSNNLLTAGEPGIYSPQSNAFSQSLYGGGQVTWLDWLRGDFSSLDVMHVALRSDGGRVEQYRTALAYLRKFPELREVDLSSESITDEDIGALVESCPNLIHATLVGKNITDASLRHLSKLEQLQRLDLRFTSIAGDGIELLLDSCPQLYELTLNEASVTHRAIEVLSAWQSKNGYRMRPFDDGSLSVFDPRRF